MTCVEKDAARKAMKEVHGGSCGNHLRGESPSHQDKMPQLFLANDDQGLRKSFQTMRKMPKARANDPSTGRAPVINRLTIPIHALVDGHNRPYARKRSWFSS